MPPYENESLHDMHALMQQLDTLNAGHLPEHLGPKMPSLPSMFGGSKKAAPAALSAKDTIWADLSGSQRKIVLSNTFKQILATMREDDYNNFKVTLESNDKTKELFQACINGNPQSSP